MRRRCLAVKACERRTNTSPPGSFASLAWHNRLPGCHSYPRYSRAILRSDRRGDDRELLLDQYAKQEEGRHGHGQREPPATSSGGDHGRPRGVNPPCSPRLPPQGGPPPPGLPVAAHRQPIVRRGVIRVSSACAVSFRVISRSLREPAFNRFRRPSPPVPSAWKGAAPD